MHKRTDRWETFIFLGIIWQCDFGPKRHFWEDEPHTFLILFFWWNHKNYLNTHAHLGMCVYIFRYLLIFKQWKSIIFVTDSILCHYVPCNSAINHLAITRRLSQYLMKQTKLIVRKTKDGCCNIWWATTGENLCVVLKEPCHLQYANLHIIGN